MTNLEKVLGTERAENVSKFNLITTTDTIYQSTIIRKYDDNPIYLTHQGLPSIIENNEDDEITGEDDYIVGDYFWNPIHYNDITFTDLKKVDVLGDINLITSEGIFELTNASLDDDCQLFYDEATLFNDLDNPTNKTEDTDFIKPQNKPSKTQLTFGEHSLNKADEILEFIEELVLSGTNMTESEFYKTMSDCKDIAIELIDKIILPTQSEGDRYYFEEVREHINNLRKIKAKSENGETLYFVNKGNLIK